MKKLTTIKKKKKAYRVQPRRWLLPPAARFGCLAVWMPDNAVWVTLWPGVAKAVCGAAVLGPPWQTLPSLSLQAAFPTSVRADT